MHAAASNPAPPPAVDTQPLLTPQATYINSSPPSSPPLLPHPQYNELSSSEAAPITPAIEEEFQDVSTTDGERKGEVFYTRTQSRLPRTSSKP